MLLRFLKKKTTVSTTTDSYVFGSMMMSLVIFIFASFYLDRETAICFGLALGDVLFTLIGLPFLLVQIHQAKKSRANKQI